MEFCVWLSFFWSSCTALTDMGRRQLSHSHLNGREHEISSLNKSPATPCLEEEKWGKKQAGKIVNQDLQCLCLRRPAADIYKKSLSGKVNVD